MGDPEHPARCFSCGGPSNELNEIEEGVNCPACAERLIEGLPGIFHEPWNREEEAAEEHEEAEVSRSTSLRPTGPSHDGPDDAA